MPQDAVAHPTGQRFADVLRGLRERAGLTQQELAERAGLTPHAVSALERGTRTRPYPHTVRSLATALGISEEDRARLVAAVPRRNGEVRRPSTPQPLPRAGLDVPATRLHGRDGEVTEILRLLREGAGLVTLTGPGGVGKTRLAAAVADAATGHHADGVVLVPLAAISDADLVVPVIARTLGISTGDGPEAFAAVVEHLASSRLLLVLDNFEHLLSAAPRVAELTAALPDLAVLVTSRSALQVRGEQQYAVQPLSLPEQGTTTLAQLRGSAAGALLVERFGALAGGADPAPADVPACAEICRRLAGLPLAIELATAQLSLLSPTALLDRLEQATSTAASRDLPERQRTMRATLDWSYGLLTPSEQRLFTLLAVFRGGASLESVEAVAVEAAEFDAAEVLGLLGRLVSSSLVVVRRDAHGQQRFTLLEPVAQYARSLLVSDRVAGLARAHAKVFLRLAEEAAVGYEHAEQVQWLARMETDEANVVLAVERSLDLGAPADVTRAVGLTWSMWLYWWLRGQVTLGRRLAEACLSRPLDVHDSIRAHLAAATMCYAAGDLEAAASYWADGDRLATEHDDTAVFAKARAGVGLAALGKGDLAAAECRFREALDHDDTSGSTWMASLVHVWLGTVLLLGGDPHAAVAPIERGLRLARDRGDRLATYVALYNLAQTALATGDDVDARRHVLEGISLSKETRDLANLAWFVETLAAIEGRAGALGRAARFLGASDGLREVVGADVYAYYLPDAELRRTTESTARANLGDDAYEDELDAGRRLEPAEVVDLALS